MDDLRIAWGYFTSSWIRGVFLMGAVILMAFDIAGLPGGAIALRVWILGGVLLIGRDHHQRRQTLPHYSWRIYVWDALFIIGFLGLAALIGVAIIAVKP